MFKIISVLFCLPALWVAACQGPYETPAGTPVEMFTGELWEEPFNVPPGATLNVFMAPIGDIKLRCANMGGTLFGNVCYGVDY